jgi:hypothetical protein
MIPETEDGKGRCLSQLPAGALCFTVAKQHENAAVDPWNKPFQRAFTLSNDFCEGIVTGSTKDGRGVDVEACHCRLLLHFRL